MSPSGFWRWRSLLLRNIELRIPNFIARNQVRLADATEPGIEFDQRMTLVRAPKTFWDTGAQPTIATA